MRKGVIILTLLLAGALATPLHAESPVDVNARMEMLEQQIQLMQTELQSLKTHVTTQDAVKNDLLAKIEKLEAEPRSFLAKGLQSGQAFKLQDALGLDEDSWLNISGEFSMQYKQPLGNGSGSSDGFRAYEIPELFINAKVNDNVDVFTEAIFQYEGGAKELELEDSWVDIHFQDELASAGNTGLKIGQFHVPFGWDNDDNEGYSYGGRTSVDASYARSQRVEKKRLRQREVGAQANYNLDVAEVFDIDAEDPINIIFSAAVLNGTGPVGGGAEWDNDGMRDLAGRVEIHALNGVIGGSYWDSPATKNFTGTDTNASKTRDVAFFGTHFKYPDVAFPNQDINIGGSKYLVWGEYFWARADEANVAGEGDTKAEGGYIEIDVPLISSKLLAFAREGYWDADNDDGARGRYETTIGVVWNFMDNLQLIVNYVDDNFEDSTEKDHIGATFKAKF